MRISVDAHAIGCHLTGNEVYIRNLLHEFARLDEDNDLIAYISKQGVEQDLPGQVMGGGLTVRHLLVQRHVQAGAAHGGSQLLDLAGECRSGFPNVVGCGQPHR